MIHHREDLAIEIDSDELWAELLTVSHIYGSLLVNKIEFLKGKRKFSRIGRRGIEESAFDCHLEFRRW